MFKIMPRVFAHKTVVDKGNFVLPDYILNKGIDTVNLFHRFCPHRMYPLHTPGEHVDNIHCKFHNFEWSKDGTPLNNPKKIQCGTTTTGKSGLVFKNFVEPDHQWVDDLSKETEPVLLFGTSLAFYDLMTTINDAALAPFELPKGSLIVETGGWKGRDIKLTPNQLTSRVQEFFGISIMNCIREYSMSEISSQLYGWGNTDPAYYHNPDWLSVRLVDPLSQTEVPIGESGIIAFVDLANVWSCPFILTEDIGHFDNGKVILEGRAPNAPEKGCSLTYAQAMDN